MPKRQSVSKIPSEEVMGEGSYVLVRHLTWGETKTAREAAGADKSEIDDAGLGEMEKLIEAAVVDWNWVDDQGEPMPLFGDGTDGTSINDLYTTEVNFLVDAILRVAQRKN